MRLKLFEEFISQYTAHSWNELRDVLQERLPFGIICFMGNKSLKKCSTDILKGFDMCEQKFSTQIDGENVTLPCLFIMDPNQKLSGLMDEIMSSCKVHHAVIGKMKDANNMYYDNSGSSYEAGSDIMTSLDSSDFGDDDHYTFDSTQYKFIEN